MPSHYLEAVFIITYMVITYHLVALKYRRSRGFAYFNKLSKIFLILLHVFIVISNIFLYFLLIFRDLKESPAILKVSGILIFFSGILIILWGAFHLRRSVFIPEDKLIENGPFAIVRHPMYSGGIIGAFGLAFFAGSILGIIYSFILAVVLSRIADAEEEDLRSRLGKGYTEYMKKVPKLIPLSRNFFK